MNFENTFKRMILGVAFFVVCSLALFPVISLTEGVPVKVLYDFSGSMYPGYPATLRLTSGAKYFYQYPHFRQWLSGFIQAQSRFNASQIDISLFRSPGSASAPVITQIQAPVPINQVDVNRIFSLTHPQGEDFTHLSESLDACSANFEGLIWMITDNRVETQSGGGSTSDFFTHLRDVEKYRSVHIYKLPFEDSAIRQRSDIAVYGILVSPTPLLPAVSRWFDQQFDLFRNEFQEQQHIKIKDLRVAPFDITIKPIEIDIQSNKKDFTDGSMIKIRLNGSIKSNLTQHTITGGTLLIQTSEPFIPDDAAIKKFNVKAIPGHCFQLISLTIPEIPPMAERPLPAFYLKSNTPLSLSISGISHFITAATSGGKIKYTGRGIVSSNSIQVELRQEGRDRITGIYSSDNIESIFGTQATIHQIQAEPSPFDVSFTLKTKSIWGLYLLLIFLFLLVPFVLLGIFLSRKENYRIKKGPKEDMITLRRLGSYQISQDGLLWGVLKRGIGNIDTFSPNTNSVNVAVTPCKKDGEYDVTTTINNQKKYFKLIIEPIKPSRIIQTGSSSSTPSSQQPISPIGSRTTTTTASVGPSQNKPGNKPTAPFRRPK